MPCSLIHEAAPCLKYSEAVFVSSPQRPPLLVSSEGHSDRTAKESAVLASLKRKLTKRNGKSSSRQDDQARLDRLRQEARRYERDLVELAGK